ncbi:type II secretion system protein [Sphingobacterium spiritivorum]|uniref:type II secretion system protein n=1 Tax=Sphingobacterium spiritivorum TaxID=258 RepID=UPI003DA69194
MINRSSHITLRASTLVEVLIALLIIMSVFAAGMVIFANINKASRSQTQQQIKMQLKDLQKEYEKYPVATEEHIIRDSIAYTIRIVASQDYPRLKRITASARHPHNDLILDSLVVLKENRDE